MAYEQKDMSGSLFRNDKEGVETRPDRTGSALIDGVEYWVSGWIKEGKSGQFLSLAFKRKDAKKPAKPDRTGGLRDMPDDRPF